ncbi:MAG: DUF1566 domain-containing protein [Proteobacteria bacterium]|nr:DUF1566 domain-containing protein [Pseudomonadota bacterium]
MKKTLYIFLLISFLCGRGAIAGNFKDNVDLTVTDEDSRLTWQKWTYSTTINWENALAYCETLSLAEKSDWRLPSVRELKSINEPEFAYYPTKHPSVNETFFPETYYTAYWSSTTSSLDTERAWVVSFNNGTVSYVDKTAITYVRCVRGGQ